MNNEDKVLEEIKRIARNEIPLSMSDEWIQQIWIGGFVTGYLKRLIETEIKEVRNLKK